MKVVVFLARVHDLEFMDEVFQAEAHDSEGLGIEYSPKFKGEKYLSGCLSNLFLSSGVVFMVTSKPWQFSFSLSLFRHAVPGHGQS